MIGAVPPLDARARAARQVVAPATCSSREPRSRLPRRRRGGRDPRAPPELDARTGQGRADADRARRRAALALGVGEIHIARAALVIRRTRTPRRFLVSDAAAVFDAASWTRAVRAPGCWPRTPRAGRSAPGPPRPGRGVLDEGLLDVRVLDESASWTSASWTLGIVDARASWSSASWTSSRLGARPVPRPLERMRRARTDGRDELVGCHGTT